MSLGKPLTCFKAYDVRGKLGEELNEEIAYLIGRATVQVLSAKTVVLGFDARKTSPSLAKAAARGLCDAGADIVELGLSGTEEVYAAVSEFNACAGIEITASHNPIEYNGMKLVKKGSRPLSEKEFLSIRNLAEANNFTLAKQPGLSQSKAREAREAYISKILEFVNLESLKPLKIVINS